MNGCRIESPRSAYESIQRTNQEPAREAAAQFAGLLFAAAFRPLAASLGFYGDAVVGGVAQSVARSERGGLTDRLARMLANASR